MGQVVLRQKGDVKMTKEPAFRLLEEQMELKHVNLT
jgi:hypothetical protein